MGKNNKRLAALCITIALIVMITGCTNNSNEAGPEGQALRTQIMFNGSSTLAPVIAAIGADFNETYTTWDNVNADFPNEAISIYVSTGGSGQGVRAVVDQTTDFGMLARNVRDSEKEQIQDFREYLVGIDALTIAINPANPLATLRDDLTSEEIMKIFSGEYMRWSDIDESLPDEEIVVVIRDVGGGAHEVFQTSIMGEVDVRADAIQAPSMGALVTRITENRYAIGYASFGVSNQHAGDLFLLKVDGIEPSEENIITGSYVIQRPLLIIYSGEPNELKQAFLDRILGSIGQAKVKEMGFVPVML